MAAVIDSFSGEYSFLSNFHPVTVRFDGVAYPSVEHAYQAAKTLDLGLRKPFASSGMPAGKAKRLGRSLQLRHDWESIKIGVMHLLLARKFAAGTELAGDLTSRAR